MANIKRKRWEHADRLKAALVIKTASESDLIAVTSGDYAWNRPFDLHLFSGCTAERDLDRFMGEEGEDPGYGDDWCLVDFAWVVANVDLIGHCTVY